MPIGRRRLPLWRDWLWVPTGPPDVSSAIRFVGRGDLGLGGWDVRRKVGSAGEGRGVRELAGGPWVGSLPLVHLAAHSLLSRSNWEAGSTSAAVLGGGGGRRK